MPKLHPCRRTVSDSTQPIVGGNKGVHNFLKGINPKMNVIVGIEFKLVNHNVVVAHVRHKATCNLSPPPRIKTGKK